MTVMPVAEAGIVGLERERESLEASSGERATDLLRAAELDPRRSELTERNEVNSRVC